MEFFNSWRRRSGILTLFLAALGMIGWLRSYICDDLVSGWLTDHSTLCLVSSLKTLQFCYAWDNGVVANLIVVNGSPVRETLMNSSKLVCWQSFPVGDEPVDDVGWNSTLFGISLASCDNDPIQIRAIGIPYAFFVIPLTLISLVLLFSKPDGASIP